MFDDHTLTLLLISVLAPIGAFDSLYFHLWRFRLATRPESRVETATHVARSLILGIVALTLAFYEPRGSWVLALAGLLGLDFVNNLVDTSLEGGSRASLGGLPQGEYVLHIASASLAGATTLAFVVVGAPHLDAPAQLVAATLPDWLFGNVIVVGIGALALATLETALMLGTWVRSPRGRPDARPASAPPAVPSPPTS